VQASSKHVQLSVPILESGTHDQHWGLFHLHLQQSCQLANQSELQLESATTDQSEEPNTTEQSEVHLESAGTEQ